MRSFASHQQKKLKFEVFVYPIINPYIIIIILTYIMSQEQRKYDHFKCTYEEMQKKIEKSCLSPGAYLDFLINYNSAPRLSFAKTMDWFDKYDPQTESDVDETENDVDVTENEVEAKGTRDEIQKTHDDSDFQDKMPELEPFEDNCSGCKGCKCPCHDGMLYCYIRRCKKKECV